MTFNELTLFQGGNDVGIGSRDTVLRVLERVRLESDRFCVCIRSDSGSIEYVSRLLFTRLLQLREKISLLSDTKRDWLAGSLRYLSK